MIKWEYRENGKEMGHVRVLFVRPGIGAGKKGAEVVRLQEPAELALLAGQIPAYLKDRVELGIYDFAVEKGSFKRGLQDFRPDLIVFWVERGQETAASEQALLSREASSNAIIAAAGESAAQANPSSFDLVYVGNPVKQLEETLIGIETERSLDEIKNKLVMIDKGFSGYVLRPMESRSIKRDGYYFLQYPSVREIHSQQRVNFNENGLIGKEGYDLRPIEEIASDIDNWGSTVYLKDMDIFQDRERLEELLSVLEERDLKRTYIAAGVWGFSKWEEALNRFRDIGLKAVVLRFTLPEDPEAWIEMEEDISTLRKRGIEPIILIKDELSETDQEALIFWLKKLGEGLVVLEGEALEKNNAIITELPLSLKIYWKWIGEFGLVEATRRQKEYKKALLP